MNKRVKSNKLVGILLAMALIACVFATMTPVALAEQPPVPELISEDVPQPELISEDASEPEAISEDAPEAVAISEDAPEVEPISAETDTAALMPLWTWIVIAVCAAVAVVLLSGSLIRGRKNADRK